MIPKPSCIVCLLVCAAWFHPAQAAGYLARKGSTFTFYQENDLYTGTIAIIPTASR
jgi:hypothetical protein